MEPQMNADKRFNCDVPAFVPSPTFICVHLGNVLSRLFFSASSACSAVRMNFFFPSATHPRSRGNERAVARK
jgi:hypothetical protein